MIDQELLAQCKEMILAVAPELAKTSLHVLDAESFPDLPRSCLGWAIPGPVLSVDPPGAVISLDGEAIGRVALPGHFAACVRNVAIHEASHLLPVIPTPAEQIPRGKLAMFRQQLAMSASLEAPSSPGTLDPAHGFSFRRIATHLWHRANALGYDVPIFGLFGQKFDCTCDASHWAPLIEQEANEMRDKTFAEIEAREAPPAARELWQEDVDRYNHFFRGKITNAINNVSA